MIENTLILYIIIIVSIAIIPLIKHNIIYLIFVYMIAYGSISILYISTAYTPTAMEVYEGKTYLTIKDGDTIVDYISNRYK